MGWLVDMYCSVVAGIAPIKTTVQVRLNGDRGNLNGWLYQASIVKRSQGEDCTLFKYNPIDSMTYFFNKSNTNG